ncbi:MAG: acyl--CoA ligase [Halioglobus sp.]|nr:acyl--CoA ligase [Halioglobus sp.]
MVATVFDYQAHGLVASATRLPLPGAGPATIGDVLARQLTRDPDRLALVGRGGRLTYAQLDAEADRTAVEFHDAGITRYDRIAACLPNDIDIVIALLACARIGAIWVGVNRPLAPPEKAFILADSGAQLYLTDAAGAEEIRPALNELPGLRVVQLGAAIMEGGVHGFVQHPKPKPYPRPDVDSYEPAAIAYTSGTTGRPKGAVHSHHNLLLPGAVAVAEERFGPDCHQGVMLPLTILNLVVLAPLTAFQDGAACVCMDSMKPEDIADWIADEKVGHFASVPTVVQDLLTSDNVDPRDLATLGHPDIGGAGIAESFQRLYRERFGKHMTVAYGMTEAPTIVTKTSPDEAPVEELCGRAVPQLEVLVVDEGDAPLSPGAIGEICVRPAGAGPYAGVYTTMLGYWNRPEDTEAALAQGMYHTGDLGYLDDTGQLFIRGRQKELIIRGGANVYPAEVERVLVTDARVSDAAVLGIDDERLGQRVVAVVQSECDAAELEEALRALCERQLARYKVPDRILVVAALPRNAMNKVIKPELVGLFAEQ